MTNWFPTLIMYCCRINLVCILQFLNVTSWSLLATEIHYTFTHYYVKWWNVLYIMVVIYVNMILVVGSDNSLYVWIDTTIVCRKWHLRGLVELKKIQNSELYMDRIDPTNPPLYPKYFLIGKCSWPMTQLHNLKCNCNNV